MLLQLAHVLLGQRPGLTGGPGILLGLLGILDAAQGDGALLHDPLERDGAARDVVALGDGAHGVEQRQQLVPGDVAEATARGGRVGARVLARETAHAEGAVGQEDDAALAARVEETGRLVVGGRAGAQQRELDLVAGEAEAPGAEGVVHADHFGDAVVADADGAGEAQLDAAGQAAGHALDRVGQVDGAVDLVQVHAAGAAIVVVVVGQAHALQALAAKGRHAPRGHEAGGRPGKGEELAGEDEAGLEVGRGQGGVGTELGDEALRLAVAVDLGRVEEEEVVLAERGPGALEVFGGRGRGVVPGAGVAPGPGADAQRREGDGARRLLGALECEPRGGGHD